MLGATNALGTVTGLKRYRSMSAGERTNLDGLINQNLQGVPGKGEIVIFKKNTQSGLQRSAQDTSLRNSD
eukprot:scaffold289776_cov21-Tisochrysis_lutea.AAC.2